MEEQSNNRVSWKKDRIIEVCISDNSGDKDRRLVDG